MSMRIYDPGRETGDERPGGPWGLPEYFEEWFVPVALGGKGCSPKTITAYRETLVHWKAILGNPALSELDDRMLARFAEELPRQQFRRGPCAPWHSLSPETVLKHLRHLRTLLRAAGPRISPNQPAAELLPRHVFVPFPRRKARGSRRVKMPITFAQAAALYRTVPKVPWLHLAQTASQLSQPEHWPTYQADPVAWWQGLISFCCYTGMRIGDVLAIKPQALTSRGPRAILAAGPDLGRETGDWLDVPDVAVEKTGKGFQRACHPRLAADLRRLLPLRTVEQPLFGWPFHPRRLSQRLHDLCRAAGVPLLGWHAFRRGFGSAVAQASLAMREAQHVLDHSDARITAGSYVDSESLTARLIRQLPDIAAE